MGMVGVVFALFVWTLLHTSLCWYETITWQDGMKFSDYRKAKTYIHRVGAKIAKKIHLSQHPEDFGPPPRPKKQERYIIHTYIYIYMVPITYYLSYTV